MSKPLAWFIYLFSGLFFLAFFLWPIATILRGACLDADGHFTPAYFLEIFRNPLYTDGLRNAFLLATASTLVTLLIALPLALATDRWEFPGKKLLSSAILVPMILPPFVGAIGLRQILGQYGALNALLIKIGLLAPSETIDWLGNGRFYGVIALNALHLYPILFLNLSAALANLDPAMHEAAQNLGASSFRIFRKITLPLIMPGLFAGSTIVFIFAFTELGVPLVFDITRVTPVQIFNGLKEISGNPFPFALVVVMLLSTALLYAVSRFFFGQSGHAMTSKATTSAQTSRPSPLLQSACTLGFTTLTILALLPHLGVLAVSFAGDWYQSILPDHWTLDHYAAALSHPLAVPSILNSLKYAAGSTLLDLLLGAAIAYLVVRTTLPGRAWLDSLAMLPLAVPGLVLAFGYLSMTQDGRFFAFLNPSTDPTLLLIIAYSVRRLPYVLRATVAGLQQTSITLEEAAQNLGCSPLRTLKRITFPLLSANLLAGGLLAFAFAMLEVSDSLILAQQQKDFPITKAIYELFQLMGEGRFIASALGVWSMLFLALTILATSRLLGKKLGALFRA